ncbi:MAG: preprotein translocase subunit SecE [Firmicutes bacterium ADurb.Bin182]|nr:MAG: preprotein translocase subunit SecE [Firmicutes bacterium ADurb.Bin182]
MASIEKKEIAEKKKDGKKRLSLGRYFKEVVGELKKLSWPSRKELINSTLTVIAFVLIFSAIIGVLDFLFAEGFKLLGTINL